MVIENAEGATHHCFRIVLDIPGKAYARSPIVLVPRKALLDIHCVLRSLNISGGQRDSRQRILETNSRNLIRNFIVIPYPIVERDIGPYLPGILSEKSQRLVLDVAHWITKALNEVLGKTQSVLLHRGEIRRRRYSGCGTER